MARNMETPDLYRMASIRLVLTRPYNSSFHHDQGEVMGTMWVLVMLFVVAALSIGVAIRDIVRDMRSRS